MNNEPAGSTIEESCARCGRQAPPPVPGPDGQADQGWVVYAGEPELVIDIAYPDATVLPKDLAAAIGEFEGLVRLEPDPQTERASIREVASSHAGIACPDCRMETGWDDFGWHMFLAGLTTNEDGE